MHHQAGTIAALNLFLGWTLFGWVIALAKACGDPRPFHVTINDVQQRAGTPTPDPVSLPHHPHNITTPTEDAAPMAMLRHLQDLRDQGVLTRARVRREEPKDTPGRTRRRIAWSHTQMKRDVVSDHVPLLPNPGRCSRQPASRVDSGPHASLRRRSGSGHRLLLPGGLGPG